MRLAGPATSTEKF